MGDESDAQAAAEAVVVEKRKRGRPKKSGIIVSPPKAKSLAERLTPEQGMELLDILLQKSIPPERINEVLLELLNATDKKMARDGSFYETVNWQAKVAGLEQALKLKRFTKDKEGHVGDQPIMKITLNVVENLNVKKLPSEE